MTTISEVKGRIHAGRRDAVIMPRRRAARPAGVFCHGHGSDATQGLGYSFPGIHKILSAVAEKLLMPIVLTSHVDGWGNTVSKGEAVDDAVVYARVNLGADNSKPVLFGASAGCTVALNAIADEAENYACFVGIIPAIDVQALRVADTVVGGVHLRTAVDTAHGVVYPAALPALVNPATRTSALSTVPQQLWYASDDAVSVNLAAYAAAVHAETHDVGALGHTPAAAEAVDVDTVIEFVRSHI